MDSTTIVPLPRVHMAGSNALHDAHLEIGTHGLALFLTPEAPFPLLDIDCTRDELREVVHLLDAALRVPTPLAETIRKGVWDLSS